MYIFMSPLEVLWLQSQYYPTDTETEFAHKMKLQLPERFPHNKKIDMGKVNINDGSWVEVSAISLPARLYYFVVYNSKTNTTFHIRTGAGDIHNYWKIVELALLGKLNKLKEDDWINNLLYYTIEEREE